MTAKLPFLWRIGVAAWSFVGIAVSGGIIMVALTAVSSVVLPVLFAAVLAVLFRPSVGWFERHRVPSPLAAGGVVLGLAVVAIAVVVATVGGIVEQGDSVVDQLEDALAQVDVDEATAAEIRTSLEELKPAVTAGFLAVIGSGLTGTAALAVGSLLGALIMYYLLKDGQGLRRQLVERVPIDYAERLDRFISESEVVLRRYWLGRTIVSAVVAVVVTVAALALDVPMIATLSLVTFIGGYVPYIGAFASGALAVVVALGDGGFAPAVAMLIVVLVANLVVENVVDPAVTGQTLHVHPLVVLLVTTIGGILGGLVGLILAVPMTVIGVRAVGALRDVVWVDTGAIRQRLERGVDLPRTAPPTGD